MYHAPFRRSGLRSAARSGVSTPRMWSSARTCVGVRAVASSTRKAHVSRGPRSVALQARQAHSTSRELMCSSGFRTLGPDRMRDRACARTARASTVHAHRTRPVPVRAHRTRQCPCAGARALWSPMCSGAAEGRGSRPSRAARRRRDPRDWDVRDRGARRGAWRGACASRAQVEPRPRPEQPLACTATRMHREPHAPRAACTAPFARRAWQRVPTA